jgi:capsular polysaccharide biosynthesis protein
VEFWTSVRVIRRRWYIVLVGLLIFGSLVPVVIHAVKPSYQAEGKVTVTLLNGQQTPLTSNNQNNFGSEITFAALMADASTDDSFQKALNAGGTPVTYSVLAAINNTPVLILSTTTSSPERTMSSYRRLLNLVRAETARQQRNSNTPESALYGIGEITTPSSPTVLVGSRIKALIVLGVGGTLITLAVVFATDSLIDSRRRKRREEVAAASGNDFEIALQILETYPTAEEEPRPLGALSTADGSGAPDVLDKGRGGRKATGS